MQSCELVTFITAIACSISKCYSNEEIAVLSAVFTQLGDTLTTISTQEDLCNKDTNSTEKSSL